MQRSRAFRSVGCRFHRHCRHCCNRCYALLPTRLEHRRPPHPRRRRRRSCSLLRPPFRLVFFLPLLRYLQVGSLPRAVLYGVSVFASGSDSPKRRTVCVGMKEWVKERNESGSNTEPINSHTHTSTHIPRTAHTTTAATLATAPNAGPSSSSYVVFNTPPLCVCHVADVLDSFGEAEGVRRILPGRYSGCHVAHH